MSTPTSRWVTRALIAVALVVVSAFAAILIYVNWINDPEDAFDEDDLAARVEETLPRDTAPETVARDTTTPATVAADASAAFTVDGAWHVDPARSEFGYRVEEVLGGISTTATGRGSEIVGSISLDGTNVTEGSFEIEVASITSDNPMRDGQFRGRVMATETHPTATFTLTEPIELDAVPAAGEQIDASATGELTLRGVTQPVTFAVTAQRDGSTIGVLGAIPVLFSDYEIDNPSTGAVTTEDDGLLEFVLIFQRA